MKTELEERGRRIKTLEGTLEGSAEKHSKEMAAAKADYKTRLKDAKRAGKEEFLASPEYARALDEHAGRWLFKAVKYCRKVCRKFYRSSDLKALEPGRVLDKVAKAHEEDRTIESDEDTSSDDGCGGFGADAIDEAAARGGDQSPFP